VTSAGLAQHNELSIAIAGANSHALSTALACHAAGFNDITLIEDNQSKPSTVPRNASVELSPNASSVLRSLKALDKLRNYCFEPQFVHQRSYRSGFQLSIQALGAMAEGRYKAPFLHIESQRLNEILGDLAINRGIKRLAGEVQQLRQNLDCVSFNLSSLAQQYDVLIVAADSQQIWRTQAAAETIVHTPTRALYWQGSVPQQNLPDGAFGPVITQWLGPLHHLSYHYGVNAQRLHLAAITTNHLASDTQINPAADPALLLEALTNWHPSLSALIERAETLDCQPIFTSTSPNRLAHGRIVFLGSSCHSLLPHLPQKTALGIEDAWVVARMLEQWEEDPASGWVEYEKYRLPRARRMQVQAQLRAEKLCEPRGVQAWQRNLGLSLSSRFLPELAMQKNDWLYGYDAVNGFE